MAEHEDIKALAKRAYEFSQLPPAALKARQWEANAVISAIVRAATPAAIQKATAELEARWGPQVRAQGLSALVDPQWYLRRDDGKPPIIAALVESALTNPHRPLDSVLRGFAEVEPDKRPALSDQVRAFLGRAWEGALGDARLRYVDLMRSRPEFNWPRDPWAAVLPYENRPPPAQLLVDYQGKDRDGGWFDDPADDTVAEKLKFGWQEAVRTWDPWILKYNPPALLYQAAAGAVGGAAGAAADLVKDPLADLGRAIKWTFIGLGTTAAAATLIYAYGRSKAGRAGGCVPCGEPLAAGARYCAHCGTATPPGTMIDMDEFLDE